MRIATIVLLRAIEMVMLLIVAALIASGKGACITVRLKSSFADRSETTCDVFPHDITVWKDATDVQVPVFGTLAESRVKGQFFCFFVILLLFLVAIPATAARVQNRDKRNRINLAYCATAILLTLLTAVMEGWYASGYGVLDKYNFSCKTSTIQCDITVIVKSWATASAFCILNAIVYLVDLILNIKSRNQVGPPV